MNSVAPTVCIYELDGWKLGWMLLTVVIPLKFVRIDVVMCELLQRNLGHVNLPLTH